MDMNLQPVFLRVNVGEVIFGILGIILIGIILGYFIILPAFRGLLWCVTKILKLTGQSSKAEKIQRVHYEIWKNLYKDTRTDEQKKRDQEDHERDRYDD